MESAVALWINDCRKKNVPLDINVIHTKAKKCYETLKCLGLKTGFGFIVLYSPALYNNCKKNYFSPITSSFWNVIPAINDGSLY